MSKPCTQKQIKAFPWTVERAAALYKEARLDYVNKGITDFNKIVDGLSARHNLKRDIIIEGLGSPKGVSKNLTDEMWVRQQAARRVGEAAKAAVKERDKGKFLNGLSWAANAPRRFILTGHFGAFTKSHMSDQLFYNPKAYGRNFKDSWSLATKHGIAQHEQRVMAEFNPTDPDVNLALRAGLNVGEGGAGYFAKETGEVTGIKRMFKGPDRSAMAFDELRISRMRIFRKELARLSPEERANLDDVRTLAKVLNHDTGTVTRSGIARFLFLSPRLFPAQFMHTYADIPKAMWNTGFGFKYKEAAPAHRYVARKAAILASAYTAIMAANTGIGLVTGDKRFMPNWGQEGISKTNWLRPKLFGYSIPISPTIELLKLPAQMIAAGAAARKGDNKTMTALMRGMRTVVGRQNPLFDFIQEVLFGQDVGTGRPTPFPGITGKTEPTAATPKMTVPEWLGSKLPIPVNNYVSEFYDELVNHGMMPKDALEWAKWAAVPTLEVATSYHFSPTHEKPAPPRTPEERKKARENLSKLIIENRKKKHATGK